MNLGVQLRVYRKSRGHSVQKVSKLTGISADKLYKWEKGTRPSDAEDLLKIREYMTGKVEIPPKAENGKSESEQNLPLQGSITIQDYKESVEQRIAEIEARRRDAEAMYQEVKQEKGILYDLIKENLTQLLVNSNETLKRLEKILLVDRVDHETTMDSLDRIEHQPVGSNATRAGIRELDATKRLQKKGKTRQRDGNK